MTEVNLNIGEHQDVFIRLILRSPDRGDGWRSVSEKLRSHASNMIAVQPELYETKEDDGTMMVRLSKQGAVLGMYL